MHAFANWDISHLKQPIHKRIALDRPTICTFCTNRPNRKSASLCGLKRENVSELPYCFHLTFSGNFPKQRIVYWFQSLDSVFHYPAYPAPLRVPHAALLRSRCGRARAGRPGGRPSRRQSAHRPRITRAARWGHRALPPLPTRNAHRHFRPEVAPSRPRPAPRPIARSICHTVPLR